MKLKALVGIIGGISAIAGATFFIAKRYKMGEINTDKHKRKHDKKYDKETTDLTVEENHTEQINLEETKAKTAEAIAERHEEAKNIMTDAVKNIMSDVLPEKSQNEEVKRKLLDEIDNL